MWKTCIWWILLIIYRSSRTQTDISIQFPQLSFQCQLHLSRTFNFVAPYWQYGWFSGNVPVFSSLKIHINMFITKNIRIFYKVSKGLNHTNTETHISVYECRPSVFAAYLHVRRIVGLLTTNKTEAEIPDINFDCSPFLLCCHRNSIPCFKCCIWSQHLTRSLNILLSVCLGVLACWHTWCSQESLHSWAKTSRRRFSTFPSSVWATVTRSFSSWTQLLCPSSRCCSANTHSQSQKQHSSLSCRLRMWYHFCLCVFLLSLELNQHFL